MPLVALDLPLKVLIYDEGGSHQGLLRAAGGARAPLRPQRELAGRFAGINALTEALLAR